jgi:DNA processing protein
VGVLGCGIDVVYPPENQGLYRRIASEGALLSEFPLGRRADRQTFPMRNRLVAGMCEAVVVVESAMKGGSLITARQAGEQGRSVFAFPGRVDQETSAGCHALVRDGAVLVTCAEDILDDLLGGGRQGVLDLQIEVEGKRQEAGIAELAGDEKKVYGALEDGATLGLEEIANTAGVEARVAAVTLMSLELKRLVAKRLDGKFERR